MKQTKLKEYVAEKYEAFLKAMMWDLAEKFPGQYDIHVNSSVGEVIIQTDLLNNKFKENEKHLNDIIDDIHKDTLERLDLLVTEAQNLMMKYHNIRDNENFDYTNCTIQGKDFAESKN